MHNLPFVLRSFAKPDVASQNDAKSYVDWLSGLLDRFDGLFRIIVNFGWIQTILILHTTIIVYSTANQLVQHWDTYTYANIESMQTKRAVMLIEITWENARMHTLKWFYSWYKI